jgi:aspartokinase-like uncharacterized kinase
MWCVAKVGGSLLDLPDLRPRLLTWLRQRDQQPVMLVAGGGDWADAVRRAQRVHSLSDEVCHYLAIEAMRTTARLLLAVVPDARWAANLPESLPETSRALRPAPLRWVLDPVTFVHDDARHAGARALPACWDVTSDSIAARVAQRLQGELVLLKSTLPRGATAAAAAAEGYVDAYFPRASAGLAVQCVDLRSDACPRCTLATEPAPSCQSQR